MTGVWNLDLVDTNSTLSKPAGKAPAVYGKNSREQWKYEMHRSLFGQLDNTPLGQHQEDAKKKQREDVSGGMTAAGTGAWGSVSKGQNIVA